MYLVTAATSFEMEAFLAHCHSGEAPFLKLITGVGPVATAMQLSLFLASSAEQIQGVLNIGIGGAFVQSSPKVQLLDLCLAKREVLGDLGVCFMDRIEPLGPLPFAIKDQFTLDSDLLTEACSILAENRYEYHLGTFVTVSCVSGTRKRGDMLAGRHQGICENMEGAAVAMVCEEFGLPLIEMRCISNMVEDRNKEKWKIREAAARCGQAAASLLKRIVHV